MAGKGINLAGKVACITGGGSGIGAGLALVRPYCLNLRVLFSSRQGRRGPAGRRAQKRIVSLMCFSKLWQLELCLVWRFSATAVCIAPCSRM